MSRRTRRRVPTSIAPSVVSRPIIMVLVVGVVLMHALVGGSNTEMREHRATGLVGESMPAPHSDSGAAGAMPTGGDTAVATQASPSDERHLSDGDHCQLGDPCVFVLGGGVPLPPVILVLLLWGLPPVAALFGWWPLVIGRRSRPPPWAMPTHLTLSVIRC